MKLYKTKIDCNLNQLLWHKTTSTKSKSAITIIKTARVIQKEHAVRAAKFPREEVPIEITGEIEKAPR
jgi:hypothetical protein